jgi:hypothetical protein
MTTSLTNREKFTPANLTNAVGIKVHELDKGIVILTCNAHTVFSETLNLYGCRIASRGMKLVSQSVAGGMHRIVCLADMSTGRRNNTLNCSEESLRKFRKANKKSNQQCVLALLLVSN